MNIKQYNVLLAFLFLLFNSFTYIDNTQLSINLMIAWFFVIAYVSYLPLSKSDIKKAIITKNKLQIYYWTGILIYCIGYLLFAIDSSIIYLKLNTTYPLGLTGASMFAIGSILLMLSTNNIKNKIKKNTSLELLFDDCLLVFFGSLSFLIGSILFIIGYINSYSIFFKYGLMAFIIGRLYFFYDSYLQLN